MHPQLHNSHLGNNMPRRHPTSGQLQPAQGSLVRQFSREMRCQ
ncbi:hypothetical protein RB213_001571 [Colletotrichum asianum]